VGVLSLCVVTDNLRVSCVFVGARWQRAAPFPQAASLLDLLESPIRACRVVFYYS
jgi:hypothetical protein